MPRRLALILNLVVAPAGAANLTVNTAVDEFGTGTSCSLREAIQSANTNADFGGCVASGVYAPAITDIINLPTLGAGGAFTLTRFTGHDDANNSTDLDIAGNLTINGVSAANTIIRGDTNDPDAERERLIHVISGTVLLRNMTLRDGRVDNQRAGGGLRTEPASTTTLVNVVVGQNVADGNAGGILNRGTMTIRESAITGNETLNAADGGGGIFTSGTLTVEDTLIGGNIANPVNASSPGGGIHIAPGSSATITRTVVENNRGGLGAGIFGGGPLDVSFSTIRGNDSRDGAINEGLGGGIACMASAQCRLERTLVTANSADQSGGGAVVFGDLTVVESIVDGNTARFGAGISSVGATTGGSLRVESSTIAGNTADESGGAISSSGDVMLINSTLAGNSATDGGALAAAEDAGAVVFRNVTVASNSASSSGGGILTTNGASVSTANSIIAGNTAPTGADCAGVIDSAGSNLLGSATGCTIVPGSGDPDLTDIAAGLAALADTPGFVVGAPGATRLIKTRAPSATSPVIDRGNVAGCRDDAGVLLPTDQVGNPRTVDGPDPDTTPRCDIGAIEFGQPVVVDAVFASGFEPG